MSHVDGVKVMAFTAFPDLDAHKLCAQLQPIVAIQRSSEFY